MNLIVPSDLFPEKTFNSQLRAECTQSTGKCCNVPTRFLQKEGDAGTSKSIFLRTYIVGKSLL